LALASFTIKGDLNESNKQSIKQIKSRILYYQNLNVKIPEIFIQKMILNKKSLDKEKIKITEINNLKKEIKFIKQEILNLQSQILKTRIIMNNKWIGYNTIIFKLVEPEIKLIYHPINNSNQKIFGLAKDSENNYFIKCFD